MSVWIQDHTTDEIESYFEEQSTALVPVGSTEQHGPHLPTGTDAYQAIAVAEEAANELGVLVAPPLWYGDARHHLGYSGTLALRPETCIEVLFDIYESLTHNGCETIVTINGHRNANVPAVKTAMKRAKEATPEATFAVADLVQIACSKHLELKESPEHLGTHAGEFETSFMLSAYPDLVSEEKFEKPMIEPAPSRRLSNSSLTTEKVDRLELASTWQTTDPHRPGHTGDPTYANVEKGDALRKAMVEAIVEFLTDINGR